MQETPELCASTISTRAWSLPRTEYDAPLVTFDETEGLYYVTSEFKIKKREMLYICAVQSGQVLGAEVASSGSALRVTPELLHKWLGTQVENSRELGRAVREFKTGSDERATRLKSEMATWHTNVYVPATRDFGAAVATFNAAYQKVASAGRINSNDMARLHQTCQGLYDAVQTVLASGALASAPDQGTKQLPGAFLRRGPGRPRSLPRELEPSPWMAS